MQRGLNLAHADHGRCNPRDTRLNRNGGTEGGKREQRRRRFCSISSAASWFVGKEGTTVSSMLGRKPQCLIPGDRPWLRTSNGDKYQESREE